MKNLENHLVNLLNLLIELKIKGEYTIMIDIIEFKMDVKKNIFNSLDEVQA